MIHCKPCSDIFYLYNYCGSAATADEHRVSSSCSDKLESAINYRPPSIIGRARALTLAATNKLIIAKDRRVNVG